MALRSRVAIRFGKAGRAIDLFVSPTDGVDGGSGELEKPGSWSL